MLEAQRFERALAWLRDADGLLITAGAGMGVDSGLPDFRGRAGLWRAYPALKQARIDFQAIANPKAFHHLPTLAWGFYGHRLELYRKTTPHRGYAILQRWASDMTHGAFVFTSNVDGHFAKAGFPDDRIVECHGTLHMLQCARVCTMDIWSADSLVPIVDEKACRLQSPLPACPNCGALARPNILMFNDWDWISERADRQVGRLEGWMRAVKRAVVIEIGAGRAVTTVRNFSVRQGLPVIRINPQDFAIAPHQGVGIQGRALEVLDRLDAMLMPRNS